MFVYAVKPDNTVELRNVQVGATEGDNTVITQGVEPGEVLVVPMALINFNRESSVQPHEQKGTTRPAGASTRPAGMGDASHPAAGVPGRRQLPIVASKMAMPAIPRAPAPGQQ